MIGRDSMLNCSTPCHNLAPRNLLTHMERRRVRWVRRVFSEFLIWTSAWDLPEEDIAEAVNDQARLMAGVHPWEVHAEQN